MVVGSVEKKKVKEQEIKLLGDLGIYERRSEIICKRVHEIVPVSFFIMYFQKISRELNLQEDLA